MNPKLKSLFANTKLNVLPQDFFIVSIPKGNLNLVKENIKNLDNEFFSVINEKDEITLILSKQNWKKISNDFKEVKIEKDYKVITFDINLNLNIVGYLAQITKLLAKNNISILAVSTYLKDHILVRNKDLDKSIKALNKFIEECKTNL